MLYAILCYHDEDTVGSWTKEQDAEVSAASIQAVSVTVPHSRG